MNFSIEGKEIVEIKCVDMKHLAQSARGGGEGGGQLQLKTSPRINSLRSTFFLSLNAGVVRVSTQCTSFKGMAQPLRMMHEFKYQVNGNDQPL